MIFGLGYEHIVNQDSGDNHIPWFDASRLNNVLHLADDDAAACPGSLCRPVLLEYRLIIWYI